MFLTSADVLIIKGGYYHPIILSLYFTESPLFETLVTFYGYFHEDVSMSMYVCMYVYLIAFKPLDRPKRG